MNLESFPGGSALKNPPAMQEMPETWVRSLGWEDPLEEGNPLQCSCLENPMYRGAWWATVHGVAKNWTGLSMHARTDPNLGWYFLFDYTGSILLNSFLLGSDFFFSKF